MGVHMTERGADFIMNMAGELNNSYQRGLQAGIEIGRRQAFTEMKEILDKGEKKDE